MCCLDQCDLGHMLLRPVLLRPIVTEAKQFFHGIGQRKKTIVCRPLSSRPICCLGHLFGANDHKGQILLRPLFWANLSPDPSYAGPLPAPDPPQPDCPKFCFLFSFSRSKFRSFFSSSGVFSLSCGADQGRGPPKFCVWAPWVMVCAPTPSRKKKERNWRQEKEKKKARHFGPPPLRPPPTGRHPQAPFFLGLSPPPSACPSPPPKKKGPPKWAK